MSAPLDTALTVLDPLGGRRTASLVPRPDGRLGLTPAAGSDASLFLSPGWVDLHTHIYDGVTQISVAPDRVGLDQGVHVLADAGSAGEATVRGLLDYVLPRAATDVRVWLNIGSHGLVHLREVADRSFIDVDATVRAVASDERIIGIKVRSSGLIVGSMGLQPLQLGREAARAAGVPLMVHVGEAPPDIADVLDLLDEGDVVTHCFHGKDGHPWNDDGTPTPALQRALDRGVLLDVGHGAASFDVGVATRAIAAGYPPNSISTDIHVRNVDGPVFGLAAVMTKLLGAGMSLDDVITAVTVAPRRVLGLDEPTRDATVFRLTDSAPPGRDYRDSSGTVWMPEKHIVALGTIIDGVWRPCA